MNIISIFEIKQNQIKLLVGYYVAINKLVVLFTQSLNYTGLIQNGVINQTNVMADYIAKLIAEAEAKGIALNKNNVFVVIDPNNMKASVRSSVTTSTSTDEDKPKISSKDIENLFMMAQREDVSDQSLVIVDVFRICYLDENKKIYYEPPLDVVSKNLEMKYSLYFMPLLIQNKIINTFNSLKIKVKKITISICALTQCIKKEDKIKEKAFSIVQSDINDTTLGVSDSNGLVGARSIQFGISALINNVAEKFAVSYDNAENLLNSYGLDKRQYTYKAAIGESIINGSKRQILQSELNEVIEAFCKDFAYKLYETKSNILASLGIKNSENLIKTYIMTGKLFDIYGIKDYFRSISQDIIFYNITNSAIDGNEYTNLLAVLSIQPQYDEIFTTEKKANNESKLLLSRGE